MACTEWNDGWIAHLYGELDAAEGRRLDEHLRSCADCHDTLRDLEHSRELIRSAIPDVPVAPRVVLLRGAGMRRPLWAFAAGAAAATLLFAAGLTAGLQLPGNRPDGSSAIAAGSPYLAAADRPLLTRLATLEREVGELRAAASTPSGGETITAKELDDRLAGLARRFRSEHSRDVEFLLEEINATEWRAANWADENREALRLVALRNDPRLSER